MCSGNSARKISPPSFGKSPRMAAKASFPTPILKPPEMKSPICFQLAWPLNIQPSLAADESAIIFCLRYCSFTWPDYSTIVSLLFNNTASQGICKDSWNNVWKPLWTCLHFFLWAPGLLFLSVYALSSTWEVLNALLTFGSVSIRWWSYWAGSLWGLVLNL